MRGVGDEAALRLQGLLERGEHRVERRPEPAELVSPALRHPLARVPGQRDPLRRLRQPPDRHEGRAGDDRARRRARRDAACRDEQEDQAQAAQRVLDVVE